MKRKSVLLGGGLLLALVALGVVLAIVLRFEPKFYRQAEVPAGPARKTHAMEFVNACLNLGAAAAQDSNWYAHFTTEQINSYLSENFVTEGIMEKLLPAGVSEPRMTFEEGKVHLAFRYGSKPWSTVVSSDIRIWLVPKEYNVVALEVESIHIGLIPVSAHSVLERLAEAIRKQNRGLEFNWYRYNGHPVALLRLQADRAVPSIRLQQVDLHDGQLIISGSEAVTSAAMPASK